ncbi:MAG: xylose isomerase, partial [Planctomycetes bacterium]|nr:xylose isomerase [Planctomycetota bacterium]
RRQRDTGRTVVLCPEPEPWCLLETSWDVAAFWSGSLAEHGVAACAASLDGDETAARAALATHLGICLDTCHVSLAFEDQVAAVARMAAAGARVAKCQFSAAPEVLDPSGDAEGVAELRALAEPRFLHQTAARSAAGSLSKVEDLDQLDECLARLPDATAVRSHFHIPVFRDPLERGLSSTVRDSVAGLRAAIAAGCTHISVETYTWSVLAAKERDALSGTMRELEFLDGAVDAIACR